MNKILITFMFLLAVTSSEAQKELFQQLNQANFEYPDYDIMKKHGYTSYSEYEKVKDSMVFKAKYSLNFEDSTLSEMTLNRRNKTLTKITPLYDDLTFTFGSDTSCCPYRLSEYDSLDRMIKKTQSFPYSMNKLKIVQHYIYVDTTDYVKFITTENIFHDLYVNSTIIIEYDYQKVFIGYERKTFISERDNHDLIKTNLDRFARVNNQGLLVLEKIYDDMGNLRHQKKYTYE